MQARTTKSHRDEHEGCRWRSLLRAIARIGRRILFFLLRGLILRHQSALWTSNETDEAVNGFDFDRGDGCGRAGGLAMCDVAVNGAAIDVVKTDEAKSDAVKTDERTALANDSEEVNDFEEVSEVGLGGAAAGPNVMVLVIGDELKTWNGRRTSVVDGSSRTAVVSAARVEPVNCQEQKNSSSRKRFGRKPENALTDFSALGLL